MAPFLAIIVSGLIAAAAMLLVLYPVHVAGLANADMLRAVGSIFSRDRRHALGIGIFVHALLGAAFAIVYSLIWSSVPFGFFGSYRVTGALLGFAHGLVVSIALVVLVAEHHPLQRFQRAGFGVALAHLGAHVVYGLVLGVAVGWLEMRYAVISQISRMIGFSVIG